MLFQQLREHLVFPLEFLLQSFNFLLIPIRNSGAGLLAFKSGCSVLEKLSLPLVTVSATGKTLSGGSCTCQTYVNLPSCCRQRTLAKGVDLSAPGDTDVAGDEANPQPVV